MGAVLWTLAPRGSTVCPGVAGRQPYHRGSCAWVRQLEGNGHDFALPLRADRGLLWLAFQPLVVPTDLSYARTQADGLCGCTPINSPNRGLRRGAGMPRLRHV